MHARSKLLLLASAAAVLSCHGERVIGGPTPSPPSTPAGLTVPAPDGTNYVIGPQTAAVHKVDLLFMIDNSASMGDKQDYLIQAIPDLLARLTTPNCVDPNNPSTTVGPSTVDASGNAVCPSGYVLEFPSVKDLHVGVVSSSLGPRLGDQVGNKTGGECLSTAQITLGAVTLNQHNDDQAHLLMRGATPPDPTETTVADAAQGFLAWAPGTTEAGAVTTVGQLKTDFTELVAGVHQYGCGIESQLESWYRFLIQPDPYDHLALDSEIVSTPRATWVGVDTEILKERHDFLRPDSLVVIVDLTDENDSEIDVRSLDGQGYLFMATNFYPPRGSSACNTNPNDPACTTCGEAAPGDANCAQGPYNSPTDWGYDLNLRHVHMKAKYGLDPQFPIQRYQNGLLSPKVPDRLGEYPPPAPGAKASYVGVNDCTNPLYAASLPDGSSTDATALCNLPPGPRTASTVYFLHIGGVPHELLPPPATGQLASTLTDADWQKILGADPIHGDLTGIDPHMVESYQPRIGLAAPSSPNNADPITGREWITNVGSHLDLNVDRQYACIFPLATPRDCTVQDNRFACDCSSTGLTHEQTSPVCDPNTPTAQVAAKAYPTIRELTVARLAGPQGLVSSICPTHTTDNATNDDPIYGYRPAVAALVEHVRPVLVFSPDGG